MVIIGGAESANACWDDPEGISIYRVEDPSELAALLRLPNAPRVAVLRFGSIDTVNVTALAQIRAVTPNMPVVAWLTHLHPEQTMRVINLGFDGVVTDQSASELRFEVIRSLRLTHEELLSRTRRPQEAWKKQLVGDGSSMSVVCELIRLVSQRRCTVLITGETGVGKEMVAKAIHAAGPRAGQPMVSINCGAIPDELLEAELFGHVKGAYTGAIQNRTGRFEQANKGTLFLDEIGDMPFHLQAKLLRVLQEREIQRLGSSETVKVDVRIIAATNTNLRQLVEQGKFREDLFYRLHVAPIQVPTLAERPEDIPVLISHFISKVCRNEQIPVKSIPRSIVEALQKLHWRGNVRELENAVEVAIAVSGERPSLQLVDFPVLLGNMSQSTQLFAMPNEGIDYYAVVSGFERILLGEGLRLAGGSKKKAAILLNLKRSTFSAKLDVLGLGKDAESESDDWDLVAQGA